MTDTPATPNLTSHSQESKEAVSRTGQVITKTAKPSTLLTKINHNLKVGIGAGVLLSDTALV